MGKKHSTWGHDATWTSEQLSWDIENAVDTNTGEQSWSDEKYFMPRWEMRDGQMLSTDGVLYNLADRMHVSKTDAKAFVQNADTWRVDTGDEMLDLVDRAHKHFNKVSQNRKQYTENVVNNLHNRVRMGEEKLRNFAATYEPPPKIDGEYVDRMQQAQRAKRREQDEATAQHSTLRSTDDDLESEVGYDPFGVYHSTSLESTQGEQLQAANEQARLEKQRRLAEQYKRENRVARMGRVVRGAVFGVVATGLVSIPILSYLDNSYEVAQDNVTQGNAGTSAGAGISSFDSAANDTGDVRSENGDYLEASEDAGLSAEESAGVLGNAAQESQGDVNTENYDQDSIVLPQIENGSTIMLGLAIVILVTVGGIAAWRSIAKSRHEAALRRDELAALDLDKQAALDEWQTYIDLQKELNDKVYHAATDWDTLFFFPAINDSSVKETQDMLFALDTATNVSDTPPVSLSLESDIAEMRYPKAVKEFERAWNLAWAKAEHVKQSSLSEKERKTIQHIMFMLDKVHDGASTEHEKQVAYGRIDTLIQDLTTINVPNQAKELLGHHQLLSLESGERLPTMSEVLSASQTGETVQQSK